MYWSRLLVTAFAASAKAATLRFSCSQLVVERLDPLVNPGLWQSPHLHQVVGGNAFNATMDYTTHDLPSTASCTSCTPSEDFSNYWTAVLFFRARNGTLHRVKTKGNPLGYQDANGGMTVYYLSSGKVTAFKPGFRMTVGNPAIRTDQQLRSRYRQLTYTCLQTASTRTGETTDFPKQACPVGIMVNIRFPTCWDGKTLDSPDHESHVAYPASNNRCPTTHPVSIPQVFYETVWDTAPFNDRSLWPADGSQPFVWSFGDRLGYGNHGDYLFGWKGDALQRAMDTNCNSDLFANDIRCAALRSQTIQTSNYCLKTQTVYEPIDGWLQELPGGMMVQ